MNGWCPIGWAGPWYLLILLCIIPTSRCIVLHERTSFYFSAKSRVSSFLQVCIALSDTEAYMRSLMLTSFQMHLCIKTMQMTSPSLPCGSLVYDKQQDVWASIEHTTLKITKTKQKTMRRETEGRNMQCSWLHQPQWGRVSTEQDSWEILSNLFPDSWER